MADWFSSMEQTFEFYKVDPATWGDMEKVDTITSATIDWDLENESLGSATIDATETLGECYLRIYLITIQNGTRERHPMGTFIVQTPKNSFDGRYKTISMDAYTPLLELKEKMPPIGYSIPKGQNIMAIATRLTEENIRAPVVLTSSSSLLQEDFVSETDDTWLIFLQDLLAIDKYRFSLDEMGRVLFAPNQDVNSLQPVWTYDDGNSSILYPDIDIDRDMYGIVNTVEVVYSYENGYLYSKVVNNDPNSPISTVSRGREIVERITDLDLPGNPTQKIVDDYATQTLRDLSTLEYTLTYSHGYCPVHIGDCVRLNYRRAGLTNVKARVVSQSISCTPGCKVEETAVFTTKLWG